MCRLAIDIMKLKTESSEASVPNKTISHVMRLVTLRIVWFAPRDSWRSNFLAKLNNWNMNNTTTYRDRTI
jgi:hypothetical protein